MPGRTQPAKSRLSRQNALIALGSDGNYSRDQTVDYTYSATVPSECTSGASCEAVGAFVGGTCTDAAGGCGCTGTVFDSLSVSGTWEVQGTDLVLDLGTADEERIAYCVDGNTGSTQSSDGLRIDWAR